MSTLSNKKSTVRCDICHRHKQCHSSFVHQQYISRFCEEFLKDSSFTILHSHQQSSFQSSSSKYTHEHRYSCWKQHTAPIKLILMVAVAAAAGLLSPPPLHLLASASSASSTASSSSSSSSSSDLFESFTSCNEFHKDCHCGSIAQGPGISLYTRVVYPNSSTVIEEYDENVPYGYKYLRMYYRCTDEENVLVGDNRRECSGGNWLGPVPRCAFNLRNESRLRNVKVTDYLYNPANSGGGSKGSSERHSVIGEKPLSVITLDFDPGIPQDSTGAFHIPLASQPTNCLRWSLSPKQVWHLTLTKPTRVHYVRFKLYGEKIEDLHLNHEIAFEMSLKNITYYYGVSNNNNNNNGPIHESASSSQSFPFEIKCRLTSPKASQYYESYQQKYSANYLVLDFLCEYNPNQKVAIEYTFPEDYDVDQLYAKVIEIKFVMVAEASNSGLLSPLSSPPQPTQQLSSSADDHLSTLTLDNGKNNEKKSNSNQQPNNKDDKVSKVNDGPVIVVDTPQVELEFKPKIFVTSLCELKLYAFQANCGVPDVPVNTFVKSELNLFELNYAEVSEQKFTYTYSCNDKNKKLKGSSLVECGNYGRWKTEFPQCVPSQPCRLLSTLMTADVKSSEVKPKHDYVLDVKYEMTVHTKSGIQVVPNGKYARFTCLKRNATNNNNNSQQHHQTSSSSSSSSSTTISSVPLAAEKVAAATTTTSNITKHENNDRSMQYHRVEYRERQIQVICDDGKWIGLESADPNCITLPKNGEDHNSLNYGEAALDGGINERDRKSHRGNGANNNNVDNPSVQLVSLPVRLIRILFALFIILCLIIISLLVYMFFFRSQSIIQQNSLKENLFDLNQFGNTIPNDDDDLTNNLNIPTIVYNGGGDKTNGGIIYNHHGNDSNFYERISLYDDEQNCDRSDLHLYSAIKNRRHERGGSTTTSGTVGGGGGRFKNNDNYSNVSAYSRDDYGLPIEGDERENSIYGMDIEDDDTCIYNHQNDEHSATTIVVAATAAAAAEANNDQFNLNHHPHLNHLNYKRKIPLDVLNANTIHVMEGVNSMASSLNQLHYYASGGGGGSNDHSTFNNPNNNNQAYKIYNQLDRSSSMFMKVNSIYES